MPLKGTIKGGSVIFACEHPKEIANKIAATIIKLLGCFMIFIGIFIFNPVSGSHQERAFCKRGVQTWFPIEGASTVPQRDGSVLP